MTIPANVQRPLDEILKPPPVVLFWQQYEVLYGGIYEEIIARRNGYADAGEMRKAKFDEWSSSFSSTKLPPHE